MRRRIVPLALALLLLLGTLSGVFALEEPQAHPAQEQIDRVLALGLMSLDENGDFQPEEALTRGMFVALLGRMAEVDVEVWGCDYLSLIFSDVDEDAYYAPYLSWAVHTGVISGDGSGCFRPEEPISREQIASCIAAYLVEAGLELQLPTSEAAQTAPAEASEETAEPTEAAERSSAPENPALPETQLSVIHPDDRLASQEAPRETEAPETESTEAESTEEDLPEETAFDLSAYAQSRLYLQATQNTLVNTRRQLLMDRAPSLETEAMLMGLFIDADQISSWAKVGVCLLASHSLMSGVEDPEGGTRFDPQGTFSRAEAAVLICRLMDSLEPKGELLQDPVSLVLNNSYLSLEAGKQTNLVATVFPINTANQTVIWYSEAPEIASVDLLGRIVALAPGRTVIHAVSSNRLQQSCVVEVTGLPVEPEPIEEPTEAPTEPPTEAPTEPPTEPEPVPETTEAPTEPEIEPTEAPWEPETEEVWTEPEPEPTPEESTYIEPLLGRSDMTDDEKDLMIFDQLVRDPRLFYASDDEALAHQVVITVKTWDLAADGTKYTRTWGLQVHEHIAATVEVIFQEIYALEEKPVIHSMGGWRPNAGKSEHKPGLAIDINWLENFYCDPNGKAITGYYFKPGEDPYSIPVGGSIDRIFNKYGFTRGIYWRSGYKDYMHYSFYGT